LEVINNKATNKKLNPTAPALHPPLLDFFVVAGGTLLEGG
jgi:hypothetical protein